MSTDKDIVFELNKIILEQTDNLWLIATGFITLEALLICHVIYFYRAKFHKTAISIVLFISMLLFSLSLAFGYLAKNVVLTMMIDYAKQNAWTFDKLTEWMTVLQIISVSLGILVFLVVFFVYSRTLAQAIVTGVKERPK